VSTRSFYWTLSWVRRIHSTSIYPVGLRSTLSSDRRTGLPGGYFFVIYLMTLSVSRTVFCRWQDNGERWIVKDFEASGPCKIEVLSWNVCGGTEESREKLWSVNRHTSLFMDKWNFLSGFPVKDFLHFRHCRVFMSFCYFLPWLGHPNEVWWTLGLPVKKLLIMLFPHRSCYYHSPTR